MCGALVAAKDTLCAFCGEPLAPSTTSAPLDLSVVLTLAWRLFQAHWRLLVLANLLYFGILLTLGALMGGASIAAVAWMAGFQPGGPDAGGAILLFLVIFVPISVLVLSFVDGILQGGYVTLLDKLVSGAPAGVQDFLSGWRYCWRSTLAQLAYGLLVMCGLVLCLFPALLVLAVFWPIQFVIVHERLGVLSAFGRCWELTSRNLGPSLLLALTALACDGMASTVCSVALLASHGFVELMFAVGFAQLTGRGGAGLAALEGKPGPVASLPT
jgi:hypothetical protein